MDLSQYTALLFTADACDPAEAARAYESLGVRFLKRKSVNTNAVVCHPTLDALSAIDKMKAVALTKQGMRLIQFSDVAEARGEVIDLEAQEAVPSELHVIIVTSRGQKFTVVCGAEHSLLDLKRAIESKTGVPVQAQRLLYSGRELQNASRTLRQLHIGRHENYNIHLVSAHPVTMANSDPVSLVPSHQVSTTAAAAPAPPQSPPTQRMSQEPVVLDATPTTGARNVVTDSVIDLTVDAPASAVSASRKRPSADLGSPSASPLASSASSASASRATASSAASSSAASSAAAPHAVVAPTPVSHAAKKQTKRKRQAGAPEEKRAARYRSAPNSATLDRIGRAVTQRLYLMDEHDLSSPNELARRYGVLGSTGNVYEVTVQKIPNCTCPDAQRGNLCKHILFVFLKVLRLDRHSHFIYQRALLQSELQEMFDAADQHAAQRAAVMANDRVIHAYKVSKGEVDEEEDKNAKEEEPAGPPQIEEGTECPICYEEIKADGTEPLDQCHTCRNFVHKDCFQRWSQQSRQKGLNITCVFCRAAWRTEGGDGHGGQGRIGNEGYLNFADEQGMSRRREYTGRYRRYGGYDFGFDHHDDLGDY